MGRWELLYWTWVKGLKHGKGKLYYANNNIKYDGNYYLDLFDGYGKYIAENAEYYIGQWSNGLKVKGTIYSKDDKVLYEGYFLYWKEFKYLGLLLNLRLIFENLKWNKILKE